MICPSCSKDADLFPAQFNLIAGWRAFKCQECIDTGMEPRFTVVLAALTNQDTPYMEAITNYTYYGPPITAAEIIP